MGNRALSYISTIAAKELPNIKPAMDIFIIRTLIAYQSLPDPMSYKSDHPHLIKLCTMPYRYVNCTHPDSFLYDKRVSIYYEKILCVSSFMDRILFAVK